MLNRDTVLLARLVTGEHVQVGKACHRDDAHAHFEHLDSQVSGFYRVNGRLRFTAPVKRHFLGGVEVSFYRLRQVEHEFGSVRKFPVSAIRFTNRPKGIKTMTTKTASGVKRPATGKYKTYRQAATVAKGKNVEHGRGYRALKALDGSYGVIFRPEVAANKQRRNREVV